MKVLILISFLLMSNLTCNLNENSLQTNFRQISVVTADKVIKIDGKTVLDSSFIYIVYKDNYVIYKIPKIVYKDNITTVVGDTINTSFINPDTTYRYFLIKKNDHFGLQYNKIDSSRAIRFSLDSLLKDIGIHSSMLNGYNLNLGKPNEVVSKGNKIRLEKYFNKKDSFDEPDSIYRYFDDKLKNIDFSYSKLLDNEKNSKLYKTSFINLYNPNGNSKGVLRAEFYSEIKEVGIPNPKDYILLINRYNKDAGLINLK